MADGYRRAGFEVLCVDVEPQPECPCDFVRADAIASFERLVAYFRPHSLGGSPPCQDYTPLKAYSDYNGKRYPRLIGAFREKCRTSGLPYVIENVPAARVDMIDPVEMCHGAVGLPMVRHRLFEPGGGLSLTAPSHREHLPCVRNGYVPTAARPWMTITGGKHSARWLRAAKAAMSMPWVAEGPTAEDRARGIRQVSEAISPVLAEFVASQVHHQLTKTGLAR